MFGAQSISQILKAFDLQKRAIRIVSRRFLDAHANRIFESFRILKFEDIIKLQIGKVMYLYVNGHVRILNSFNDMFLLLTVTYIHITLEVRIPSVCLTAGQM